MEKTMTLKLLVGPKGKRVIFAEAGKDFVDFLFHILCLPVASVYKLLGEQGMVANLYKSITDWNNTHMLQNKNIILAPKAPECTADIPLGLLDAGPGCEVFYGCSNKSCARNYISDDGRDTCKGTMCYKPLDKKLNYYGYKRPANELGFVKDVTYMVTDDMIVKPLSTVSIVDLLNRFNVETGELKVKEVKVTKIEALELFKASMNSNNNNVLTSIFLKDESKKNSRLDLFS